MRRRGGAQERLEAEVINSRPAIDAVRDHIVEQAQRLGYDRASCFAIRLALEEAMSNAFRHGHRDLPPDTPVRVRWSVDRDRVELTVEDRGPGFDPSAVPDPTDPEHLERPGGRGLFLIRSYMAEVGFNERGNRIRMVYRRPGRP